MAKALDALKGIFSKKKEGREESATEVTELLSEEIVKRILEKYEEEGAYLPPEEEEVPEQLVSVITTRSITSRASVPLSSYPSPVVKAFGGIYEKMRGIVDTLAEKFVNNKLMRKIDFDLYAANIPLTAGQFVGLVVTAALVVAGAVFLLTPLLLILLRRTDILGIVSIPVLSFLAFLLTLAFGLTYPSRKARARGAAMEKELPFALRHLAVVIRSGMSLYQAMESIASANYGILSQEFRRTLREISEGKTTEEALESLALRSHSRAMRRTVSQITRALRIGGNLSDAIRRIAEDLTFEQLNKVREFSEKLNLIGVVFMFVGVVFPTLMAILNGIGNAPTGMNILAAFAMPPSMLISIYLIAIPLFMLIIILFVKKADPLGE